MPGQEEIDVDQRRLKHFQDELMDKSECLKQLDATVLDSLYDEDADDEICMKEAEEVDEIQEKISFKLILY